MIYIRIILILFFTSILSKSIKATEQSQESIFDCNFVFKLSIPNRPFDLLILTDVYEKDPKALESFKCSNSKISGLKEDLLKEIPNTKEIDISQNRIKEQTFNLSQMASLTSLNLSENFIKSSTIHFSDTKIELENLNLSKNFLTSDLSLFEKKSLKIQNLDLSNNLLTKLPESHHLNLNSTSISTEEETKLKNFDISNNIIKKIDFSLLSFLLNKTENFSFCPQRVNINCVQKGRNSTEKEALNSFLNYMMQHSKDSSCIPDFLQICGTIEIDFLNENEKNFIEVKINIPKREETYIRERKIRFALKSKIFEKEFEVIEIKRESFDENSGEEKYFGEFYKSEIKINLSSLKGNENEKIKIEILEFNFLKGNEKREIEENRNNFLENPLSYFVLESNDNFELIERNNIMEKEFKIIPFEENEISFNYQNLKFSNYNFAYENKGEEMKRNNAFRLILISLVIAINFILAFLIGVMLGIRIKDRKINRKKEYSRILEVHSRSV